MKLLIEIPEKMYHMINAGFYDYGDMNVIIQNGIPLMMPYKDRQNVRINEPQTKKARFEIPKRSIENWEEGK